MQRNLALALLIVASVVTREPGVAAQEERPWRESPIVAAGGRVFAIAERRNAVLQRDPSVGERWARFADVGTQLAGLTGDDTGIYVADATKSTVYFVSTSGAVSVVHAGAPLVNPSCLAGGTRALFISDAEAGTVFAHDPTRNRPPEPVVVRRLSAEGELFPGTVGHTCAMAADGIDAVLFDPVRAEFLVTDADAAGFLPPERLHERFAGTITHRSVEVGSVLRLAVWRGAVYALNLESGEVFTAGLTDLRFAAIPRDPSPATAIAASRGLLTLYDSRTDALAQTPALEPVSASADIEAAPGAFSALLRLMSEQRFLPLTYAEGLGGPERTLTRLGYPEAVAASVSDLICAANGPVCGEWRAARQDAPVAVQAPNLLLQSTLTYSLVDENDARSVSEALVARVQDPTLRATRELVGLLPKYNPQVAPEKFAALDRLGAALLTLPVERLSTVVALPPFDGERAPRWLEQVQALGLSLSSLRRIRLTPQSAAGRQAGWHRKNSATWNALKQQYADLRNVIRHVRLPVPSRHVFVGIADSPIVDPYGEFAPDGIHRVLSAPLSEYRSHSDEFAYQAGAPCDLVSGCPDHGYMVASLIAARRSPLEEPGLAPHAIIVPLRRDSPDVGSDIEAAISQGTPLLIVNVSAAAAAESPLALREVIRRHPEILFVVAAGGEGKLGAEICDALAVYPACWGREGNVLVVGALTQDGTTLLAGMNFGPRDVHLGAPGAGWALSTGRRAVRDAYGSSFATPIATAVAAWLRAIEPTPRANALKHRLMATADWDYYAAQPKRPDGRCYSDCVVAGRVHFQRAVQCPAQAQFYDQPNAPPECVEAVPSGDVSARYADGITRPVRLADILRATRIGNGPRFRLVQVTPAGELDIQQVTPIGEWTVIPIGGGESRDITGYADYVAPMPSR